MKEVEEYQPFVNKELWLLFKTYTQLLLRIYYNLARQITNKQSIHSFIHYWFEDDLIKEFLDKFSNLNLRSANLLR